MFFCYSPALRVAALFSSRCENVLPTLRGVHFFIALVHRQVVDRSACVYAFRNMRFPHCVAFTLLISLVHDGLFAAARVVHAFGNCASHPAWRSLFHVIWYSLQVIKGVASFDVISSRFRFHFTMYVCACLCSRSAEVIFICFTL